MNTDPKNQLVPATGRSLVAYRPPLEDRRKLRKGLERNVLIAATSVAAVGAMFYMLIRIVPVVTIGSIGISIAWFLALRTGVIPSGPEYDFVRQVGNGIVSALLIKSILAPSIFSAALDSLDMIVFFLVFVAMWAAQVSTWKEGFPPDA